MKPLLIVFSSQSGRTRALAEAALRGARAAIEGTQAAPRLVDAGDAILDDLVSCSALLLCTPENFGYMSGKLKDFFDRTYYPAEGLTVGLPYAVLVSAGNDGSGAVRAIERIASGYGWHAVAEPLIVRGEPDAAAFGQAFERAQTLVLGVGMGLF